MNPNTNEDLLTSLQKQITMRPFREPSPAEPVRYIPSGAPEVDRVIGRAGLPAGRIVEMFGPEAVGKTTLVLDAIAANQRMKGVCVYIDADRKLDPGYATLRGVHLSRLLIYLPFSIEEAFDQIEGALIKFRPALIVLDSLLGLLPHEHWWRVGNQRDFDSIVDTRIRAIALLASEAQTTVFITNQVRDLDQPFWGPQVGPFGGRALRHHATVRIELAKHKIIKNNQGDILGSSIKICAVKNQLSAPWRQIEYNLLYVNHDLPAPTLPTLKTTRVRRA